MYKCICAIIDINIMGNNNYKKLNNILLSTILIIVRKYFIPKTKKYFKISDFRFIDLFLKITPRLKPVSPKTSFVR